MLLSEMYTSQNGDKRALIVSAQERGSEWDNQVEQSLLQRRVLLVEDSYLLALDLSNELVRIGAEVLGPFADLDTAFALVRSERQIDAAVIDINLNGESSYQLVDELVRRDIPVVFSTGYDQDAVPYRLRHIRVFSKPLPSIDIARGFAEVVAEERARER
jgi:CheY-like chemotaxis protein